MTLCVLLTALEASGDALGAGLMRVLRRRLGADVRFVGVGGAEMVAEGLTSAFDVAELSIVGIVEGLLASGRAARRARELADMAVRERADVAVLIDSWGFSYFAASQLRRRLPGLRLIKYVAPQVWATRPGRARATARAFDHLLSIISFEAPIFEKAGALVTFVGHPALGPDRPKGNADRFRSKIGAGPDEPILLVLPGSRHSEIARLAQPFQAAATQLKGERPGLRLAVVAAGPVMDQVRDWVATWPVEAVVVDDPADKGDAMAATRAALACSGTVTTELAAAGCPMVVGYRLGPLTYQIARRIVRSRYITLLNIAAGAMIAPELIQADCTGPGLAKRLRPLIDDDSARRSQSEAQTAALQGLGLGVGPPAELAADAVIRIAASAALVDRDV